MTFPQLAILVLLSGLLVVFAIDRFRIELVAFVGLAAGVLLGIVSFTDVFSGFANPAVITVAEILMLTGAINRSSLMDLFTRRLAEFARYETSVLALVCSLGALTSVFMNNIGALALWVPVTLSLCRSTGVAPGKVLIPLSFATLLGGTCSLIGTPANLVVSNIQMEATGRPFGFFDLAWVGIPVTVAGIIWLVIAAPRLLAGRGLQGVSQETSRARPFLTELRVTAGSPLAGQSVSAVASQLRATIYSHLRANRHVFGSRRHQVILPDDILLVEADANAIAEANDLRKAEFNLAVEPETPSAWVEAVVLPQSVIIGSTLGTIEAFVSRDIQVVAIGTHLQRIEGRLGDLQVRVGDVLLLYGQPEAIAYALEEVGCLPLSPQARMPIRREGWLALIVFVAAVALAATNLIPPEIAFGLAVLLLAATSALDLRSAIAELNWPILLMLAAMIPLGDAVATTGLADLIARNAVLLIGSSDPLSLTATVLISAVVITPFVNNVSAAIALGPIAAALAKTAGLDAEPRLIAVAIGVSLDFLTPFGHHNNALVMSIGTYRFGDFARLGFPLTLGAALIAMLAIQLAFR
jgi:di/tricarboxylate transporter